MGPLLNNRISSPTAFVTDSLIRWDTSSLPDAASIQSADITLFANTAAFFDNDTLNFEWHPWNSCTPADYALNVPATAGFVTKGTLEAANGMGINILFTSVIGVNPFGHTGIRMGIAGGVPTAGQSNIANFAGVIADEPQLSPILNVCYVPAAPTATPSVTPTASPTRTPTITPTLTFTRTPTITPTGTLPSTFTPTITPTALPATATPTPTPTATNTFHIVCVSPTPTSTFTPSPTPLHCPYTFTDPTGDIGSTCLFLGTYNQTCGATNLPSAFAGDGTNVSVILGTDPAVTFQGRAISGNEANLTQVQAGNFPAEFITAKVFLLPVLAGGGPPIADELYVKLGDDQQTPFALCNLPNGCSPVQNCPFAYSDGRFLQVISPIAPPPARPPVMPVWNEVPYPTFTATFTPTPTPTPTRTPTPLPIGSCCDCAVPVAGCFQPTPGVNCGICTPVLHAGQPCTAYIGGCVTVTPTPTTTRTPSKTPTVTPTKTPTRTPTKTKTPTPNGTLTPTPTALPADSCCICVGLCTGPLPGVNCGPVCTVVLNAGQPCTDFSPGCATLTPTPSVTPTPT